MASQGPIYSALLETGVAGFSHLGSSKSLIMQGIFVQKANSRVMESSFRCRLFAWYLFFNTWWYKNCQHLNVQEHRALTTSSNSHYLPTSYVPLSQLCPVPCQFVFFYNISKNKFLNYTLKQQLTKNTFTFVVCTSEAVWDIWLSSVIHDYEMF